MKMEIGTDKETPLDEIWRDNEIFKMLRTESYKDGCGSCGFKKKCGGCRARAAYYHNGDYMAEDPLCIMNKR